MSSESQETSKESEFGMGEKDSPNENALSSPNPYESISPACTDGENGIRSETQRPPSSIALNPAKKQSECPKPLKYSDEILKKYYTCNVDKSKLSEQPLDFSAKPIPSTRKRKFSPKPKKLALDPAMTSQDPQENGANSPDREEAVFHPFANESYSRKTREPREVFHTNGTMQDTIDWRRLFSTANKQFLEWKRNPANGLKSANSSGSEDELPVKHPSYYNGCSEPNGDHFQSGSLDTANRSAEGSKSPHSLLAMNGMSIGNLPWVPMECPNLHSENGSSISREKKDGFKIQNILSRDSKPFPKENHLETGGKRNNSVIQQRTSSQSISNHFGEEENLHSSSNSPGPSANLPPRSTSFNSGTHPFVIHPTAPTHPINFESGYITPSHPWRPPTTYPFEARTGISSNVPGTPMQTAVSSNHTANLTNFNTPREASTLQAYNPAALLEAHSMYMQSYQSALSVGRQPQRQKKQSAFKELDPGRALSLFLTGAATSAAEVLGPSHVPYFIPSNDILNQYAGISELVRRNSSPDRRSPDSPNKINGSSGNGIATQNPDGESSRKRVRLTPPEEKDEKYRIKRTKNNEAARKSRDLRKIKEMCSKELNRYLIMQHFDTKAVERELRENIADKEKQVNFLMSRIMSFRENCCDRCKEKHDVHFNALLPQQ